MGHERMGFDHPNLVSGNYDTIIAGMSITAERDEVIDFTQNYSQPDPSAYLATSMDADIAVALLQRRSAPSKLPTLQSKV